MRMGAKALAMLAGATLALTACASGDDGEEPGEETQTAPITFTWGYEQEFASYNGSTVDGNSSANAVVLNQVLRGFYYLSPDGSVTPDKEYGTFEKTSDDPLTIKYTINDKAAFSDGEPIDCDDAVMNWLANSGTTGEAGFSSASTAGYEDMNKPQCADGDKTFTVTYKTPFADWSSMFGPASGWMLPAHIVEKQGGVTDIIAGADTPTSPEMAKAIAFYNTGWNLNPGQLKPEVMPSAGPYKITKWQAGQSLTLEANDKWWGTKPKSKTIVIRYLGGDQQAQALQNGEIDTMDPQPQVELVNQLRGLGDRVKFSTSDQYTFEHYTFNFKGLFADRNMREAFAKCIPRQQIVDNLIKPQNPDAKIMQARYVFPFEEGYAEVENVGGEKYNTVDIAGAKQLVDAAGKAGTTVRVGWRKDPEQINKRRVDTLALVQASCKQAGFNVVDAGTPDFFDNGWPNGNFDVAMFAWAGSPLVTSPASTYTTGGGNNNGKYSNPQVDALIKQLNSEIDTTKQTGLIKQIETLLWQDLMSIPLFAFPGILASVPEVEGVEYNATQSDLSWNAYAWTLKQ
jgi:peptide/nickel transport system substrate-binding protein